MTTFKMLLLLMATVVIVSSCGDKEDVYDSDDYFYYLDIKSEVRLYLNDAADEDESGMVNPMVDHLSRTIYHMQKAIRENENQISKKQNSNYALMGEKIGPKSVKFATYFTGLLVETATNPNSKSSIT